MNFLDLISNIVMNASNTLGYGLNYDKNIDLNTLGAFVTSTTTLHKKTGVKNHIVKEANDYYVVLNDLENPGIDEVVKNKIPALQKKYPELSVVLSIHATSIEDYLQIIEKSKHLVNVIGYEINLLPEREDLKTNFQLNQEKLSKLILNSKNVTDKLIFIKLSPLPNLIECVQWLNQLANNSVAGIIIGNGFLYIDKNNDLNMSNNEKYRLIKSGRAVKKEVLELIVKTKSITKIPLIGCGGIYNSIDALEYLRAGACAIQVGSANYESLDHLKGIIDSFKDYS